MESSLFCNCFSWKVGFQVSTIMLSTFTETWWPRFLYSFFSSKEMHHVIDFSCFGKWATKANFRMFRHSERKACLDTEDESILPALCARNLWCEHQHGGSDLRCYAIGLLHRWGSAMSIWSTDDGISSNMASVHFAPGPFKLWCGLWQGSVVTVVINMKQLRTWWTSFNRFRT